MRVQACGAEGTVRHGGIRDGKRRMVQSASWRRDDFGAGSDCHRGRRHGRRRRLHQPRLSGQGHPLRLLDPAPVDGRRHCRAVRGVLLRRARRDVSALERRVQFPWPCLPPGVRICCGLGLGDRRLRRPGRAGRDGLRRVRQVDPSQCAAAVAGDRRGVAGVDRPAHRRPTFLDVSIDRDHPEGGAHRRVPGRGLRDRQAAAGVVRAVARPIFRMSPARRSRSAWSS